MANNKDRTSEARQIDWFLSIVPPTNGLTTETQYDFFYRSFFSGQRLGQAFLNALDSDSYETLSGSPYDPFYRDDVPSVLSAIDFLTRQA